MTSEILGNFIAAMLGVFMAALVVFKYLTSAKGVKTLPGGVESPLSPIWVMNFRESVLHVLRWQEKRTPRTAIVLNNGMRPVGHNMWFDDNTQFGVRVVIDSQGDWFIIFSPQNGNYLAYLVTSEGRIYFSHDRAEISYMSWKYVSRSDHPFVTKAAKKFPAWKSLLYVSYIMLDSPPERWDTLSCEEDKVLF